MNRRAHPIVLLGVSVALLALSLVVAPFITKSGLSDAVYTLHLPRAVFGAVAGFGLALAGVVLQAVLRNPLASPYTLGIASGAAVGAVTVIQLGWVIVLPLAGVSTVALGALAGAAATAGLVYAVASARQLAAETLLLAGVAVALFGGAALAMLHYLADTIDLMAMVRWSMGSLEVVGWSKVRVAAVFTVAGCLVLLRLIHELEVAGLDDPSALGLGVDPVRVRTHAFIGTSIVTAGVVAFAGPIGFVGLVVPHAVRFFTGPDPRLLAPCAACLGGAFLVSCDVVARTLLYPTNLPINVITHAIGCPAFVWILIRRSRVR